MQSSSPASDNPGNEWVPGLIAGDKAAFDMVFRMFFARVYAFTLRMTKDRTTADDVVQETFVRLARNSHKLRIDTNLRAYLFTIARRLVISHIRSMQVRAAMTADFMRSDRQAHFASPAVALATTQSAVAIENAIANLPESFREAVILVAIEQLDPREAAAILDISYDNLRQRLARARKLLAGVLNDVEST